MKLQNRFFILTLVALTSVVSLEAAAATIQATPQTYKAELSQLVAGDTLELAPGHYPRLNLAGMKGAPGAFITITGPTTGDPAIIDADTGPCCNTVQLDGTAYVAIKNLTIDGRGVNAADGINAKGSPVHDILIENVTLIGHGASQQTVAISTKTTAWNWVIRRNRIIDAGTGLYLGNSNGKQPFIGGIIEENFIDDTIGYCMQVKYQTPREAVEGMPTEPTTTIIRHNVFSKRDRPSEHGDRPNLLVGGFPTTGPGSDDRYEIYGNFFIHNPREALLQASGRVSIHDNIFVDTTGNAITLANHDLPLRQAHVYNNTIFGANTGIHAGGDGDQGTHLVGNVIFAATPIGGKTPTSSSENVVGTEADAANHVVQPSRTLPIDLYPLAGKLTGAPLDLTLFTNDTDFDRDFNGAPKGDLTFRGAYTGSGENPGWALDISPKGELVEGTNGGTNNDGTNNGGTNNDGTNNDGTNNGGTNGETNNSGTNNGGDGPSIGDDGDNGCACTSTAGRTRSALLPMILGLLFLLRRRAP